MRQRQRVAGIGRGLLALHNIHVRGKWQKGKAWAAIQVLAPEWVIEMLEVFIKILTLLEEQELKLMDPSRWVHGPRVRLRPPSDRQA